MLIGLFDVFIYLFIFCQLDTCNRPLHSDLQKKFMTLSQQ